MQTGLTLVLRVSAPLQGSQLAAMLAKMVWFVAYNSLYGIAFRGRLDRTNTNHIALSSL